MTHPSQIQHFHSQLCFSYTVEMALVWDKQYTTCELPWCHLLVFEVSTQVSTLPIFQKKVDGKKKNGFFILFHRQCSIFQRGITNIYKINLFNSIWSKASDWVLKLSRKVFIQSQSCFPVDFHRTGSTFTTTAITIWWPSDRMKACSVKYFGRHQPVNLYIK